MRRTDRRFDDDPVDDFRFTGAPQPLRAGAKAAALGPYTGGTTLAATRGKSKTISMGVTPRPSANSGGKTRKTKPLGRTARKKLRKAEQGGTGKRGGKR